MAETASHDAASLRDALAVMADWEGDMRALFGLDDTARDGPSSRESGGRARPLAAPYVKPRRKNEAAELREEIEALQRVVDSRITDQVDAHAFDSVEARALRDEWRSIAKGQDDERLAAQVENDKLRRLVETQTKGAGKIARLMQRAETLGKTLPCEPTISFEDYRGPSEDPETQLQRLTELTGQAASVFGSTPFVNRDRKGFRKVYLSESDPTDSGLHLELVMSWLLPFAVDDVAGALWVQATRQRQTDKVTQFMDLYEDANSLVSQFISVPMTDDSIPLGHGQVAVRQLPKDDDMGAILLVSDLRIRLFDGGTVRGIIQGHDWRLVEPEGPHEWPADKPRPPLSRVSWCRHVHVCPPNYYEMSQTERAKWIHTVVTGPMRQRIDHTLQGDVQNVENMLLNPTFQP